MIAALYCLFFGYVGMSGLSYIHENIFRLLIKFDIYNTQHVIFCFHSSLGAGGLSFLQFCNLNSFRTKFVLGFSIFLGLSIPQYFNEYTAINGYGPVHTGARWVWNYKYDIYNLGVVLSFL